MARVVPISLILCFSLSGMEQPSGFAQSDALTPPGSEGLVSPQWRHIEGSANPTFTRNDPEHASTKLVMGRGLISGPCAQSQITNTLKKQSPRLKKCYTKKAKTKSAIKIMVAWQINAEGKAQQARVVKSSMKQPGFERCVTGAIQNTRFKEPQGGASCRVRWPFVFRR